MSSSPWKDKIADWGPLYGELYSILGTTVTLFPGVGLDGSAGGVAQPTATTFTTLRATSSGVEAVATYTKSGAATAPYSWSQALNLTKAGGVNDGAMWQGKVPLLKFNGTNELITTPDIAYFTRVSAAWSCGLWVNFDTVNAAMSLLSKYDNTTAATQIEWDCGIDASGRPYIHLHDDSVPAQIGRRDATALVAATWNHLLFVDAGTDAVSGLDIYLNGVAVDDTDDNAGGVYAAMEDKTSLVRIGARYGAAALEQFFDGGIALGPSGPWFVQAAVTAAQAKRVYQLGQTAMGLV